MVNSSSRNSFLLGLSSISYNWKENNKPLSDNRLSDNQFYSDDLMKGNLLLSFNALENSLIMEDKRLICFTI